MKKYRYVGPKEIEKYGQSDIVRICLESSDSVLSWIQQTGQQEDMNGEITATYIVDTTGKIWITDRHYEHVACARGVQVLSAGEISFSFESNSVEVSYLSNQSTGYCPEPDSWTAVQNALTSTSLPFPNRWSKEFHFRRCSSCLSINVVKDDVYICAVCNSDLDLKWNF